ncbi:ATP-dependent acyl-CoA ligase [Sphingomonas oligophenolica]|uniref:Class I adenylate-forming enzyme family protein n=1 Tax=Sphingomonas oligophenolica TaxID=301154 RepID=A0ABU9YB45_9SPHN
MINLVQLIATAALESPSAPFGTFQENDRLDRVLERATLVADSLRHNGLQRGDVVAIIGTNCASYIITWMAAQLLGIQTAQINPGYPDEFLETMLDDIAPKALVWVSRSPGTVIHRPMCQIDASRAWLGEIATLNEGIRNAAGSGSGADCSRDEIAAYLHTSGTSGNPKFCALSHGYFLRLGRYFADTMSFTRHDVVFNPLPLFHINPIGNGVVGALTGRAGFLSTEKFSAPEFWPMVKQHGVTALILHGPPVSLLKAKTTAEEAIGHRVRVGFACEPGFLQQFGVPLGVGGYGSTEAGGYCHSWKFRPDDSDPPPEGASHLAGQSRYDIEWHLADGGEILVRGKAPQVLFSGYYKSGAVVSALDEDGWFHTGDRGRLDAYGNLIFIERMSESIRVNAEYVPIDFVEDRLRRAPSLKEFALWRLDSQSRGHEAVIYTVSEDVNVDEVRAVFADLPRYMHPTKIIRIDVIPRDTGVGKVQRRLLGDQAVIAVQSLS